MGFLSAYVYLLMQMFPLSMPSPFGCVSVLGIVFGWSEGYMGN